MFPEARLARKAPLVPAAGQRYAEVHPDGIVQPGRSFGVTQANVSCLFSTLPATVLGGFFLYLY